jgi:cyanophycinase
MTRGRLVLVGSGEFTPAMAEVDGELLASTGKSRPRVAIVPTASGLEETPQSWSDMGAEHFAGLGAEGVPVMVLRRGDAEEKKWIDAVREADWIYFSGGRPQHAIGVLQGTPFWEAVARRHREGAILAGSSAGAMMLGEKSYAPDDFDENGFPRSISLRDGLGVLAGHFVIPHFDLLTSFPAERVDAWVALWPAGLRCLAIEEDTAVVETANGWLVRGKGRAITMLSFTEQTVHESGTLLDQLRVAI